MHSERRNALARGFLIQGMKENLHLCSKKVLKDNDLKKGKRKMRREKEGNSAPEKTYPGVKWGEVAFVEIVFRFEDLEQSPEKAPSPAFFFRKSWNSQTPALKRLGKNCFVSQLKPFAAWHC
ncbi:hypothetical protein AVEN_158097-1 [Araneus ventricosus]|uniref:Uncharacterized protein n=1 Tax=Araneus ventricosus TaxID=182803 RepID=A0A4Y2HSZ7_ARAVE|nr:hypothetical protein AVEN_158097-1 [Araneus ventricosus]